MTDPVCKSTATVHSPFTSANRGSLVLLAFATVVLCAGCPEAQIVTVTVKEVAGGGAAAGGGGGAEATTAAGYGNLVGTVTFDGTPPSLAPLVAAGDTSAKDAMVCAAVAVPDESLVVNA